MNLKLIPFSMKISKKAGYGLALLGVSWNNNESAIGFNFYRFEKADKIEIRLVIFFYSFIKTFVLKTKNISHYVHTECGKPLFKNSFYCKHCDDEELYEHERTWIEVKS